MDVESSAKKRLKDIFLLFVECPTYEGIKTALIEAIEAYFQIGVIKKKLKEEGRE